MLAVRLLLALTGWHMGGSGTAAAHLAPVVLRVCEILPPLAEWFQITRLILAIQSATASKAWVTRAPFSTSPPRLLCQNTTVWTLPTTPDLELIRNGSESLEIMQDGPQHAGLQGSGWHLEASDGSQTSQRPTGSNRSQQQAQNGSSSHGPQSGGDSGDSGRDGRGRRGPAGGVGSRRDAARNLGKPGDPFEDAHYSTLGVSVTATLAEIKAAYRKLALKLHPDVSASPDAHSQFLALTEAYDVLSEPAARELYDRYGADGMRGRPGATAGRGNSQTEWEEFKV